MLKQQYLPWPQLPESTVRALKALALQDWSFGILPWKFRRPILTALANYFTNYSKLDDLHLLARNTLNFMRFKIGEPYGQEQVDDLIAFILAQGTPALAEQAKVLFTAPNVVAQIKAEEIDRFFRARLALLACKDLIQNVPSTTPRKNLIDVLRYFLIGFAPWGEIIPVASAKASHSDTIRLHIRAFYFWRWQYAQRNTYYQKLQKQAAALIQDDVFRSSIIPMDLEEYFMLPTFQYPDDPPGQKSLFSPNTIDRIDRLNQLTEESRKKYKILICWPIQDYGSDVILERILNKKFEYWERPTPASYPLDQLPTISKTSQNALETLWAQCKENFESTFLGEQQDASAYSTTLAEYFCTQCECGKIVSHEEIQRMRTDDLHRAIGLCLWDYLRKNQCSTIDAINDVQKRHPDLDVNDSHFYRCLNNTNWWIKNVTVRPRKK